MYCPQRGSGKRSSFNSYFTFGCWSEDGQMLPRKGLLAPTDDE